MKDEQFPFLLEKNKFFQEDDTTSESMDNLSFRPLEFEARGVKKITRGITTGLW